MGENHYFSHDWVGTPEGLECRRCCVRSYDERGTRMKCGENLKPFGYDELLINVYSNN